MKIIYYWSKLLKKLRGSAIRNSSVHKTSKIESGSSIVNSNMDRYSFCGYNCEIINCNIGSFCSIANGVVIGGSMHPTNWVSMSPVFYNEKDSIKKKFSTFSKAAHKRTTIGHDVWIGQNVLIKQGVNIGTGSVIGMGSVVTKDVSPYSIVAGNPSKLIRNRFDDEIIIKLLSSEWWFLDDKKLHEYGSCFSSPVDFLKSIEK